MSSLVDRVKSLQLPKGQYVVIGSGLLDALGLRKAGDLDLAVSDTLFEQFHASGEYTLEEKYGAEVLTSDDIEIWKQWQKDLPFSELIKNAVEVDGVAFVHPDVIIQRKSERGLAKDIEDIRLLKEHLARA